uniref:Uncharacterized protein n=1 Tax=Hyaloperonospora arabidopsidis (strain Emoy2) TaxID=559515 RepID=M4B857_HYAAE
MIASALRDFLLNVAWSNPVAQCSILIPPACHLPQVALLHHHLHLELPCVKVVPLKLADAGGRRGVHCEGVMYVSKHKTYQKWGTSLSGRTVLENPKHQVPKA